MLLRRNLSATALITLAGGAGHAQTAPEILARFPNGTFLENLVVAPDGSVLFTNYFSRAIEAWSAAAGSARLCEVPAHPVSLTALGGGRQALVVHGAPFNAGPQAMRGQAAVLLLDAGGAVLRRIALPEAVFPNGALLLATGLLLVADSALGCVWAVDLGQGTATRWIEHAALQPDRAQPLPGVNGIKRAGEGLLLSNSATRQLLRLNLAPDGIAASGDPVSVAAMRFGVDDFALAADGTVYAATHAQGLARLPPGADAPMLIPAPGLDGSTAVALTPDGRALLALGTGGLLEGGRGEAVLARLALG
jgi:sugar lactone lactonase YvrE